VPERPEKPHAHICGKRADLPALPHETAAASRAARKTSQHCFTRQPAAPGVMMPPWIEIV
jgi:hypothetical protein